MVFTLLVKNIFPKTLFNLKTLVLNIFDENLLILLSKLILSKLILSKLEKNLFENLFIILMMLINISILLYISNIYIMSLDFESIPSTFKKMIIRNKDFKPNQITQLYNDNDGFIFINIKDLYDNLNISNNKYENDPQDVKIKNGELYQLDGEWNGKRLGHNRSISFISNKLCEE